MQKRIATWFFTDSAKQGEYAQMTGDSRGEQFRDVYRRCIATLVLSSRRANPDAEIDLFLNEPWDDGASSVARDVGDLIRAQDVRATVLEYSSEPPETFTRAWRNQFFVLDVLQKLAEMSGPDDLAMILDSDIVWTGGANTSGTWAQIDAGGIAALPLGYAPGHIVNGMSALDVARLLGRTDAAVTYYGGEFVGVRGDVLPSLVTSA